MDTLFESVRSLDSEIKRSEQNSNMLKIEIPVCRSVEILRKLRDEARFHFDMLCSHSGVDWLEKNLFELNYILYSTKHNFYIMVSTFVPRDEPVVDSVCEVWAIAQWQEREVFDMYGVLYRNHPDLRRILLDDDWVGYPLRKDYKDEFMLELN
jgi:NADH-quinone oxidoreductase subunit C